VRLHDPALLGAVAEHPGGRALLPAVREAAERAGPEAFVAWVNERLASGRTFRSRDVFDFRPEVVVAYALADVLMRGRC
jgi:hypothetical protein